VKVVVVAVAIIAAVLLLAGAGAAYYLAGMAQLNATQRAVNADIGKLNASLAAVAAITKAEPRYPDFTQSGTPADFVAQAHQFDGAADQAKQQIAQLGGVVAADRSVLSDAQRRLDAAAASWLTLPQRSRLAGLKRRIEYEQQALDLAGQMVAVAGLQVQTAREAVDALAAYADMVEKLQAGDYAGSLADYPNVHGLLAAAGSDGARSHLPPVWSSLLSDLNTLVDDTRDGVQAVQNGDSATAQAKATALDADSKALDGLDTSPLDQNAYLDSLLTRVRSLESKAV
jgi:hypothetical protein